MISGKTTIFFFLFVKFTRHFPLILLSVFTGLRPRTAVAQRLAIMCVLPIMLAGVLGAPSKHEQLTEYLRRLLVQGTVTENQAKHEAEIFYAIRFLW